MKIPLTKPFWGKREERAAVLALRTTHGAGDGPFTKKLVTELRKLTGSRFVIPVTSCTHGLELAMVSLRESGRFKPGDEVIVPSFTMSSTANAVLLAGAKPVFADIEDTYFGLDPTDVAKKITKRTKGVIFVPYAGMAGEISQIQKICKINHFFLVEDAAHAIGAVYKNKTLGTFSDIGVYSFHGTKNISCGEGGAVLTNNKDIADIMEIYRANGTNRAAFLAGIVDKYSWVDKGTSFFLSDILASIVVSQLYQLTKINKRRNQIAAFYTKALQNYQSIFKLPSVPEQSAPNWHIYAILFNKLDHRNTFLREMRKKGIDVAYHYVPLHSSKMGKSLATTGGVTFSAHPSNRLMADQTLGLRGNDREKFKYASSVSKLRTTVLEKGHPLSLTSNSLPVTERVWERLIRLPIYPGLTKKELEYIVTSARKILKSLN